MFKSFFQLVSCMLQWLFGLVSCKAGHAPGAQVHCQQNVGNLSIQVAWYGDVMEGLPSRKKME